MNSIVFKGIASSLIRNAVLNRCFSTPARRLMKKGTVSPINSVPEGIMLPSYVRNGVELDQKAGFSVLNDYEIEGMREAGRIAKKVCEFAGTLVKPGVTLDYIDKTTHEFACSLGFYPSCLGKSGFPKSISISVNEVVCHSIPDDSELMDGDIVKIDLVMFVRGFHGDTCRTFECGNVDDNGKRLIKATQESLNKAIAVCKPGANYWDIGRTIEECATQNGFNVVKEYCGHGIGREMHMLPYILHFANGYSGKMVKNQVFTIEPMLVEGSDEVFTWDDQWAVATKDNGRCAQFEHTIIITDDGAEILTYSVFINKQLL